MSTKNGVLAAISANTTVRSQTRASPPWSRRSRVSKIAPRIRIEERNNISFAVSCRHCTDPLCVKGCISGALTIVDGAVQIDSGKCVGCYTCILSCPYGALSTSNEGAIQKCELCAKNAFGQPMCVQGCPNKAIVYEER